MSKWLYGVMILVILTASVALILKLGYEPAPKMVMKPSFFSQPTEIGGLLYRRFYVPIEQLKLVVIGIPPQPAMHREVIRGLLLAAAAEGKPFERIIKEAQMPDLDLSGLPPIEVQSARLNTDTLAEFVDAVRESHSSGKRTLVYTASVLSSHLLNNNPTQRFEKLTGEALFTITLGPLALSAPQEHLIDPPCLGSERDRSGTAKLGCAYLMASRQFYRKKIADDRYVAVMNSPRPNDYLLMIAYPGQSQTKTN